MTLKSSFLANESPAARRSRALHRFTVASPLVLLMAVGMVGHVGRVRYARPTSPASYEHDVLAYVPRVAAVQTMQSGGAEPNRKAVDMEADRWLAGYRSGQLRTLKPAFFEDHLQNGPRGEVMRAAFSLADLLILQANHDLLSGHAAQAAGTALRAAQVGGGVRDFEGQSLLQDLIVLRRSLMLIERAWPSLSDAARSNLRPEIAKLRVDPALEGRLQMESAARLRDYRFRQQGEIAPSLDLTNDRPVADAMERSIRIGNEHIDKLLR